jgi:phosphate transport system protein
MARMSTLVQANLEAAAEAFLQLDARLAEEVIEADRQVDDEEVRVETDAIHLLALQQPTATDLRHITSIIKANVEFERIGDCAVNVAQRVPYLLRLERYDTHPALRTMAGAVTDTLRQTIRAFNLSDELLAFEVIKGDDVVDALYEHVIRDALGVMETGGQGAIRSVSEIMIAKNLERVADHCTNVAENVIYVHTGKIIRHQHAVS